MGWRKYLRKEMACMKDDLGVTLDFVKMDRTKEIFHYGSGENKKSYNIKREEMYDIKLKGLIFTKVVYFYNVNNPMPLNFEKSSNRFEPIVSPRLYNRMLENEILIKLNTLSSNINYKMLLIIAGLCILGYLAYQSGMFGNHDVVLNATSNMTNSSGNFTHIGTIRTTLNTTVNNISKLPIPTRPT